MNRHFQAYNALPCEPLGKPLRKEEKPSPETQWKPCSGHPDYLERINPQGIREVTHKDHVPPPIVGLTQAESEARRDAVITPLAPTAPTEWQSGPPPSVGWWPTTEETARHFDGLRWSIDVYINVSTVAQRRGLMRHTALADQRSIRWRGPRLTGEAWPEPQQ